MHTIPSDERRFICATQDTGRRLDVVLSTRFRDISRTHLQRLIAQGHVTVNGQTVTQKRLLQAGDHVQLQLPPVADTRLPAPEHIPLAILYEDRDILAIDKPAGLVVHPAPGHDSGTLVNALLHHYCDVAGAGGEARPGIVHRLDKDTSGVILIARNNATYLDLTRQFRQRTVRKEYLALVHGTPVPAAGTIDAALARHPRDRQRFAVTQHGGRAALTFYRIKETLSGASLLDIRIATGRTHQIRVHLAWRGHPVLGDPRYGGRKSSRVALPVARQMLHAHRIRFVHPATGSPVLITSPVPPDIRDTLHMLRTTCLREHPSTGRWTDAASRRGAPDLPAPPRQAGPWGTPSD